MFRLLDALGWKMAMLSISGICLLNSVFAICFKPLESVQVFNNIFGMSHNVLVISNIILEILTMFLIFLTKF